MSESIEDLVREVTSYVTALQAENAKLRNEVDNLLDFEHLTSVAVAYAGCDECGEYKQTMLRLFAENAKLRELIRDYHAFADSMCAECDCDGCSQRDEGACERGVLTSRECVLGVEVE